MHAACKEACCDASAAQIGAHISSVVPMQQYGPVTQALAAAAAAELGKVSETQLQLKVFDQRTQTHSQSDRQSTRQASRQALLPDRQCQCGRSSGRPDWAEGPTHPQRTGRCRAPCWPAGPPCSPSLGAAAAAAPAGAAGRSPALKFYAALVM